MTSRYDVIEHLAYRIIAATPAGAVCYMWDRDTQCVEHTYAAALIRARQCPHYCVVVQERSRGLSVCPYAEDVVSG